LVRCPANLEALILTAIPENDGVEFRRNEIEIENEIEANNKVEFLAQYRPGVRNILKAPDIIGEGAFYGCEQLTAIRFPLDGYMYEIEGGAFQGCTGLTELHFPASLEVIHETAFYGCTGLTELRFPDDSAIYIIGEDEAFGDCPSLKTVYCPANLEALIRAAIPENEIEFRRNENEIENENENEIEANNKEEFLAQYRPGVRNILKVPEGTTEIGSDAFSGCTGLDEVRFPDESVLTIIGDSAFYECPELTKIHFPASLTTIGRYAFVNCAELSEVRFPDDSALTIIGVYAFSGCVELSKIHFPASLSTIGAYAFEDCTELTELYFPHLSVLTEIGHRAFDTGLSDVYCWCSEEFMEKFRDKFPDNVRMMWANS